MIPIIVSNMGKTVAQAGEWRPRFGANATLFALKGGIGSHAVAAAKRARGPDGGRAVGGG